MKSFEVRPLRRPFPHKPNIDGSFDSICSRCFTTIDSQKKEIELKAAEDAHICGGLNLRNILHPMDRA
jgi:hypothetical protein